MWNRKRVVAGLAVASIVVAGCSETAPTEPIAQVPEEVSLFGAPADPHSHDTHRDARMVRLAQQVPGFGGFYTGPDGTLNVVMKAGASAEPLRAQLGTFNVVAGQYDFIELDAMHRQVGPVLGIRGVVYTDADEMANRVVIGAESSAVASVERALGMLGISRDAVLIREAAPIYPMQTLRDRVRPVAGGLQINFPGFLCTLGFNVRSATAPAQGFITNSHCTNNEYGTGPTGTPYWQPLGSVPNTSDPNFIGTEVHDLSTFTGGTCPAGRVCRWSDSAGGRYAPGIQNAFARIYRTTGPGSITIDQANPMFSITAERAFPNPGDTMHKVGRTTGWTSGTVTQSCVNTNVSGVGIPLTLLCQEHVTGGPNVVGSGDSGAPVFDNLVGNNVRLVGLLWGGGGPGNSIFVFSAMNEIRFEHPATVQGHAWRTFPPPAAP
jgi:hypothetical protein